MSRSTIESIQFYFAYSGEESTASHHIAIREQSMIVPEDEDEDEDEEAEDGKNCIIPFLLSAFKMSSCFKIQMTLRAHTSTSDTHYRWGWI